MKTPSDPTVTYAGKIAETITSLGKLLLQSRHIGPYPQAAEGEEIIVMGNGPSLRGTIENEMPRLRATRTLAVNFAACTPEFNEIRPDFYVLADPVFFTEGNPQVDKLMSDLGSVSWDMILFVPRGAKPRISNPNIRILPFNMVGVEGSAMLEDFAFRHRLGMPRPRNVLIPSLMIACWLGFKKITIKGADHSWMETLRVDGNNNVISVQPHFYSDSTEEKERVRQVYADVRLHHIIYSFYVAFRAYHSIERYASKNGITIVNETPDSFIDAFRRQ